MEVHLNESPSEKEGKFTEQRGLFLAVTKPSMKVPPKRKGNLENILAARNNTPPLNESPSEKEGK